MKLKRAINLFEVIFFGVGVIIGAGVYTLIGRAAGVAGNSLWISFLIAALASIFTGLSYAELSTMYPKNAAEYVYVKKASNSSFLAFIIGWMIIITAVVSVATVSLGFAGYFSELVVPYLIPNITSEIANMSSTLTIPIGFALVAILSIVNYMGIKESSWMNILFTSIEIIGLVIVIILGMFFGNFNNPLPSFRCAYHTSN